MSEFEARGIGGELETGQLARETNWWGAFVIGLAGTVLVIGLIGYALVALGGFSIVLFGIIVTIGVFLCFCLAEMAATWPERAGGLPSYAFESFRPLGKRVADHVGGISSWAYWLGWFTVAPINAFLAALYIVDLFDIDFGGSFGPISSRFGAEVPVDVFVVARSLLLVMFIPCWLGIRLGATFATVLGVLTIIPLVLLCVLPLFKPGSLDGFDNLSLSLSSSPAGATGSWQLILGWSFIFTWSVLAMEAAACYIGECREPVRDAKIAITAEGLFGFFVYVTLPIMVFAVLGTAGFDQLAKDNPGWIGDANILFQGYVDKIFGVNDFWTWLIGLSLIIALSLSVLNAIMGASRGMYQNAHDGILPRAFGWANKHKAPSFSMLVSLIASIAVLTVGSPLQIYVFSNMGYLFALAVSLVGYGIFRSMREDTPRGLKMPRAFGPLGLIVGVIGCCCGRSAATTPPTMRSGPNCWLTGSG
jgi:amino acid transporter